jgi:hypothetical protein
MRNTPLKAFAKSPLKGNKTFDVGETGGGGTEKGASTKRIIKKVASKFADKKGTRGAGSQVVNTGSWSG